MGSPTKLTVTAKHATARTGIDNLTTCPVCNQLVPAENSALNQHIDECLNCLAVEECLSNDSTPAYMYISNKEGSSSRSSKVSPPFELPTHDSQDGSTQNCLSASSSPSSSRKRSRAAGTSTTQNAKRLLLNQNAKPLL